MRMQSFIELLFILTPGVLGGLLINKFIVEKLATQLDLNILLITIFLTIPLFVLSSFLKRFPQPKKDQVIYDTKGQNNLPLI